MPRLVDGQLTPALIIEALEVLRADGPGEPMLLEEIVGWLRLHVESPRPPGASGAAGRSVRRRRHPAGAPGRMKRDGVTSAIAA